MALALVLGALLGWWCFERMAAAPAVNAIDFTYPWRAARYLLDGKDPYVHMTPAPYAQGGPFLYPLTTAVLALPFAPLSAPIAGAVFFGLSSAALVYALTRESWWPLTLLLSPSFVLSYYAIQWPPIIVAGALMPTLAWVIVAKPNLAVVAFAYRPRWSPVLAFVGLSAIAFLLVPRWPLEWLGHLRLQQSPHLPAALWPLGIVGVAGLLRWRTPEGRALVAMTLVPTSSMPYDHLLLWLVARNLRESVILSVCAWVSYLAVLATAPHDLRRGVGLAHTLMALGLYVPATFIVLRRPNEGHVSVILDRVTANLPHWIRGTAPPSDRA